MPKKRFGKRRAADALAELEALAKARSILDVSIDEIRELLSQWHKDADFDLLCLRDIRQMVDIAEDTHRHLAAEESRQRAAETMYEQLADAVSYMGVELSSYPEADDLLSQAAHIFAKGNDDE